MWLSKSREVMKLFLHAARRGLEYAERASLSGSEPVVGSEGVAFVLAPPHTPRRWPAQPGPGASGPISADAGL